MNCRGCGVEINPTDEQVNAAVDEVLESSLQDAIKTGGVCPLCGHSKEVPYSQRKAVQFALLLACLLLLIAVAVTAHLFHQTARASAVRAAIQKLNANPDAVRLLGEPIKASGNVSGEVKEDETGWSEAHLTIPVHGTHSTAIAHIVAGSPTHGKGASSWEWVFTTFDVVIETEHKKLDLVTGKIVIYDPSAYMDTHVQGAAGSEVTYLTTAPTMSGTFPCVYGVVGIAEVIPRLGDCVLPTTLSGPVDRFEADLRYGRFVMRQTDLYLKDVFDVPLTRTYTSNEWSHPNPVHAFGQNTNHPFDIAPVGRRNPYTYQLIVLEDGDSLYFKRVSKGTGYADAVYQHVETATRFYKATTRWNGNGWTVNLADGSSIRFPESYNAKNMAQGAPTEMTDLSGNKLELQRDGQRNLRQIRTPHGRAISLTYDDQARIVRAEDDGHNWAQYRYNNDGMLTDVVLSSGKERHYEYDGKLMTRIIAENHRVLLHNTYDEDGFLVRQDFGNGASYSYDYRGDGTWNRASVIVTLPDKSTKTIQRSQAISDFVKHPPEWSEEPPKPRVRLWFPLLFAIGVVLALVGIIGHFVQTASRAKLRA